MQIAKNILTDSVALITEKKRPDGQPGQTPIGNTVALLIERELKFYKLVTQNRALRRIALVKQSIRVVKVRYLLYRL